MRSSSLFIVLALNIFLCKAQTTITLQEAVALAQQNSIQATLNKNNYEVSNQTFKLQRAQLFPQLNLNANLPGYNSSITSVTQPDGTIKFTTVEQAYSNIGISLNQRIAATGGTFTASSNINRFDRLTGNRTTNFNTQPFVLGFNQPLFRFNEAAFNLKTARINKLIGSKVFIKEQQQLALEVSNQFHALLQSQQQLILLQANKINTDSLLQAATLKLKLGKIDEEEYLQIQLEQINTTTQLQQVRANYDLLKIEFCNLLAIPTTDLSLVESKPNNSAVNSITESTLTQLIASYKSNSPEYEQQKLAQLQNEAALKRAKLNRLPNLNLIAGYGSNQSAPILNSAYQNVLTQQNATIGIAVPLFSSGANSASLKIASYQLQNQNLQLQQLEQRVTNEVMSQIQAYNMAIEQISSALFADSIAQRRYEISYNKYQVGKITYTDLLAAQNQKIQAKQNYTNAIATYWQAYYQLRVITLFNIETNQPIMQ